MKWGVRHEPKSSGKGKPSFNLSSQQKKVLKRVAIGAAVAGGVLLASYGGVKANDLINKSNMKTVVTIGKSFGERFGNNLAGTVTGTNPFNHGMNMVTRGNGQRAARLAGTQLGEKVSTNIYNSNRGIKKLGLYMKGRSLNKGKKTPYDMVDYNKTVKSVLQREDVLKSGESFARNIRTALANGGKLPRELKYW